MFDLKNEGLRHNKTTESCSSSHSSRLHVTWELWCPHSESEDPERQVTLHFTERNKKRRLLLSYMISKYRNFPWYNYYSTSSFLHGDSFLIWIIRFRIRLKWKRYPIQIQTILNIRPDWTPKTRSCTPLHTIYIRKP